MARPPMLSGISPDTSHSCHPTSEAGGTCSCEGQPLEGQERREPAGHEPGKGVAFFL